MLSAHQYVQPVAGECEDNHQDNQRCQRSRQGREGVPPLIGHADMLSEEVKRVQPVVAFPVDQLGSRDFMLFTAPLILREYFFHELFNFNI